MRDCDGKRLQILHREDQRTIDQAVQHQPVLRRIDRGNAAMMALVEQSVRRDDAVELLQRRRLGRGNILLQRLRDVLDDALLERRRRAIELAARRIARRLHPLGNVGRKIAGIAACRLRERAARIQPADRGTSGQCSARLQQSPARCLPCLFCWFAHGASPRLFVAILHR